MTTLPDPIKTRLADIREQTDLLERIIESFGSSGEFDQASRSGDELRLRDVNTLERRFEIVHNYLAELARLGLIQAELRKKGDFYNASRDFAEMSGNGLITEGQADRLVGLQEVRNYLAHDYVKIDSVTIYESALILRDEVRSFLSAYADWMQTLGFASD